VLLGITGKHTIPLARAGEADRQRCGDCPIISICCECSKIPLRRGFRLWPDSVSNGGCGGSFAKTCRAQSRDGKLASLLKDHHPGYTRGNNTENQRVLKSNRTKSHDVSSGAAKKGSALLSGLLRACARCGHKLHVAYRSRPGEAPRYYCMTGNKEQGKPSCLCFGRVQS